MGSATCVTRRAEIKRPSWVTYQCLRLLKTSGARYVSNGISHFYYFRPTRDKGGRLDDVDKCGNVEREKAFSRFSIKV